MSSITVPSLMWGDFYPVNNWHKENSSTNVEQTWMVDETTGRSYDGRDTECIIRGKFAFISIATPFTHAVGSVINVAYRISLIISLSHFWINKEGKTDYALQERALDAGKDVLRVMLTPIAYIALELSALYGIFCPLDGRKLYASFERAVYERPVQAPCMQPAFKRPLSVNRINPNESLSPQEVIIDPDLKSVLSVEDIEAP